MTHGIDLDGLVLERGAHDRPEDGLDIMEAVARFAGEPHSDTPRCASKIIAAGMRAWNDDLPNDARQQLKAYIPLLVDTAASVKVELARSWMALDGLVRVHAPAWLRLAGATDIADRLAGADTVHDAASADAVLPLLVEALKEANARWAAAGGGNWEAARAAIGASGGVALWEAARASRAARSAAIDAARAASGEASGAATVAGADVDAAVAELQASAHELFHRMIGTTAVGAVTT